MAKVRLVVVETVEKVVEVEVDDDLMDYVGYTDSMDEQTQNKFIDVWNSIGEAIGNDDFTHIKYTDSSITDYWLDETE